MLNLAQRLILGCVLLAGLTIGLAAIAHRALAGSGQSSLAVAFSVAAVLLATATVALVLAPVRSLARDVRKIAQGNLEHRAEWSSRDSFGAIAAELNRIAVRLRELRESEAGRRQMEFQLSDAVLQSIFEPIIVTDGKGHLLKINPGGVRVARRGGRRSHGPGQHPGRRQDPQRHSRRHRHAEARGCRRRSRGAPHAHRQAVAQLPPSHHAHARLRRPPAGHRHHARRRHQPAGSRSLQDPVPGRRQPQAARPAAAVAARALCAHPGFCRRAECRCRANW